MIPDAFSLALHLAALFVILIFINLALEGFSRRRWTQALDRSLFQGGALLLSWLTLTWR